MTPPSFDVPTLAVLVSRAGELPLGADETVSEAGGAALVVGERAAEAARALTAARWSWAAELAPGLRAGALSAALAPLLADVELVLMPASPDGRDLAPRVAAALDRPLLAYATAVGVDRGSVEATLSRLDGRLDIAVTHGGPAVATFVPGSRSVAVVGDAPEPTVVELVEDSSSADVEVLAVLEPDAQTMELSEAKRVVAGGGGLVPRDASDDEAKALFDLLGAVANELGASVGATRVATDAGWIGYDRQIGTTGVTIDPDLYIAFGISGASQHTGGLGTPKHVVSINTDPSSPMTAMADLGIVTDARELLIELAHRLDVPVPAEVEHE